MNNIPSDIGKKVAVLGLGESGYQSAIELQKLGFEVFATDKSDTQVLRERVIVLEKKGIRAECGQHSLDRVKEADWALISPGIPPQAEIYQSLLACKKPIYSEIEAASWFCPSKNIVAVTGSCGKTTTVTLIQRIFKDAGKQVVLCGNIGNPWIGELSKITPETWVILEVSSFQLKHCLKFKPHIGVLLNIYANHLDWHSSAEDYSSSKFKIFQNMKPDDWILIQDKDEKAFSPFPLNARKHHLTSTEDETIVENAARQVAEIADISFRFVDEVFKSFDGLEHRLEKVGERDGFQMINDSKSTTPASLIWGLERYADNSVVLIAGGRVKTESFRECLPSLRKKAKKIIVLGEARPMMLEEWAELNPISAESLKEASEVALNAANKNDTILFSPACSSFDMFKSYSDRGSQFKQLIQSL